MGTERTSSARPGFAVDKETALRHAAERLAEEHRGTFGAATIDRFLTESYDGFASRATVPTYLPLLAERFARLRLHALARAEGRVRDGRPAVLFLCVRNGGRSQMARAFLEHHAGDRAVGWSGGSEPGGALVPAVVTAMAERGIDISGEAPQPWTDETLRAADVVVTMGCGDACPIVPGTRYLDWELDDPAAEDLTRVRLIRDEIERRVLALLAELGIDAAA